MAPDPVPPRARADFSRLIERLRDTPGVGDPVREGFGDRPLYAGRKMFAHLDDDGALVLRLPPERATVLIADGTGAGWGVRPGQPLKGYLGVPPARSDRWLSLALEAHAYMRGKNPSKTARAAAPKRAPSRK